MGISHNLNVIKITQACNTKRPDSLKEGISVLFYTIGTILAFLFVEGIYGQTTMTRTGTISLTLPSIMLLDIEPSASDITLEFLPPAEAGDGVVSVSNNSLWINYTNAATATHAGRRVLVNISSGVLPDGVALRLTVGPILR